VPPCYYEARLINLADKQCARATARRDRLGKDVDDDDNEATISQGRVPRLFILPPRRGIRYRGKISPLPIAWRARV